MPDCLCEHCTAVCCRYIALPIDKPVTGSDFDDIRWFLIHEGVSVFVEDGDWYISFQTNCKNILPDHHCRIYRTRPKICRRYTTDDCDYHSGDYNWQHHFTAPEHLDDYLRAHPPRQRKRPRPKAKKAGQRRPSGGSRASRGATPSPKRRPRTGR